MARRYAQIDWLTLYIDALDNPWLTVNHLGLRIRIITDVYSPIKPRLTNAHRHANICSK
jgi:hypothetical protein